MPMTPSKSAQPNYFWYHEDCDFKCDSWWLSSSTGMPVLPKSPKRISVSKAADERRQMRELLVIEEARLMQREVGADFLHPLPERVVIKGRDQNVSSKDEAPLLQIDQASSYWELLRRHWSIGKLRSDSVLSEKSESDCNRFLVETLGRAAGLALAVLIKSGQHPWNSLRPSFRGNFRASFRSLVAMLSSDYPVRHIGSENPFLCCDVVRESGVFFGSLLAGSRFLKDTPQGTLPGCYNLTDMERSFAEFGYQIMIVAVDATASPKDLSNIFPALVESKRSNISCPRCGGVVLHRDQLPDPAKLLKDGSIMSLMILCRKCGTSNACEWGHLKSGGSRYSFNCRRCTEKLIDWNWKSISKFAGRRLLKFDLKCPHANTFGDKCGLIISEADQLSFHLKLIGGVSSSKKRPLRSSVLIDIHKLDSKLLRSNAASVFKGPALRNSKARFQRLIDSHDFALIRKTLRDARE